MAHDPSNPEPLFSATAVDLEQAVDTQLPVLAEEVFVDRTAFGFDAPAEDIVDAEVYTTPIPMDVRPVPMKYAAAAAMMLGVLGLFVGRQLSDVGPATSMAASAFEVDASPAKTVRRMPGKSYILYATAPTRADADEIVFQLWKLRVECSIEENVAGTVGFAIVGTRAFDLVNGLPLGVRRHMPGVVDAGFNPEPIHWPRQR